MKNKSIPLICNLLCSVFCFSLQTNAQWTEGPLMQGLYPQHMTYANGTYFADLNNPTTFSAEIATSTDQINWDRQSIPGQFVFMDMLKSLSDRIWITVQTGGAGYLLTSSDGAEFSSTRMGSLIFHMTRTPTGTFIMAGGGGGTRNFHTSTDGETWTQRDGGIIDYIRGLAASTDRVVALANSNSNNGPIPFVSMNDGETWTHYPALNNNVSVKGLVFHDNLFVAIGDKRATMGGEPPLVYAMTSTDGITWEVIDIAGYTNIGHAMVHNGTIIAAAKTNDNQAYLLRTTDGITWTPELIGPAMGINSLFQVEDSLAILAMVAGGSRTYSSGSLTGGTNPAPAPWQNAQELSDDIYNLNWFGTFSVADNGWIYHAEHGWLFSDSATEDSIWVFDAIRQAWWWTSSTVYPDLNYEATTWLHYATGGTPAQRWFFNYSTNIWMAAP